MDSLDLRSIILESYRKTNRVIENIIADDNFISKIEVIAKICTTALQNGKKMMFCGNGGSAADSQHLSGELVSRFKFDRPGLYAIALTVDTSIITAIGNDYGYEKAFSRQVEAIGQAGDILIGFSTSGKSTNIIKAMETAKLKGIITIGMLGLDGNAVGAISDHNINIPSTETPHIQEGHIMTGHILCDLIEQMIFGNKK
ncbi:Phosphoheptose isomerase [Candidatus Hepatincolaceae symbiont of Richtersius coronifer]